MFLVTFMISIIPTYAAVPAINTTESNRTETVWSTGSDNGPTNFNPWSSNLEPWSILMFETLFGFNMETQEYIPCIGENWIWNNSGRTLLVDLNPNAKWSDGTTIDSEDVVKSYEMASRQLKFKDEFSKRFDNFTIVDDDTAEFGLKANSTYSKKVLEWISSDVPILPWDGVYEEINASKSNPTNGSLATFKNDWLDSSFNATWKVASGPYTPVYRDAKKKTSIYRRRDDWWGYATGVDLYDDIPNWNRIRADEYSYEYYHEYYQNPKYVGNRVLETTKERDRALIKGTVDLHSSYYEEVWKAWERAEQGDFANYINSWYLEEKPYQAALSSIISIGFNHQKGEPFNQSWFREALAWVINYDPIPSAASSGYWKRATPGFIDDKSPAHKPYYNDSITQTYQRSYNTSKAKQILEGKGCTYNSESNTWSYKGNQLGPYTMLIEDRKDMKLEKFSDMICADFTAFGIPTTIEYTNNLIEWEDIIHNYKYDFTPLYSTPYVLKTPFVFLSGFYGEKNISGWQNNTFISLYELLETENDTVVYEYLLDEIQLLLAKEIPEIPCFVDGYWYQYSDFYWDGWTNALNNYQQICTTWTNNQFTIKQRMILNLVETGRYYWGSQKINFLMILSIILGFLLYSSPVIICLSFMIICFSKLKRSAHESYF